MLHDKEWLIFLKRTTSPSVNHRPSSIFGNCNLANQFRQCDTLEVNCACNLIVCHFLKTHPLQSPKRQNNYLETPRRVSASAAAWGGWAPLLHRSPSSSFDGELLSGQPCSSFVVTRSWLTLSGSLGFWRRSCLSKVHWQCWVPASFGISHKLFTPDLVGSTVLPAKVPGARCRPGHSWGRSPQFHRQTLSPRCRVGPDLANPTLAPAPSARALASRRRLRRFPRRRFFPGILSPGGKLYKDGQGGRENKRSSHWDFFVN